MSKTRSGFTIVELLIVIVVVGILAAIIIVAYNGIQNRARETVAKEALSQSSKKLELYKVDTGSYPSNGNLADAGVTNNGGTAFQYSTTSTGYCLTAVNGTVAYRVTESTMSTSGACSGHSLPGALSCSAGYIPVPGNSTFGTGDFCIAKYESKYDGSIAVSQAAGTPFVIIRQSVAATRSTAACSGCRLISEAEWLTVAHNVLGVASNWTGGSVGSGAIYSGHNDNIPASALAASSSDSDGYSGTGNTSGNQRRTLTLSNGEVIWDLAGNVFEWTSGTVSGGQPGGSGSFPPREWNALSTPGTVTPNPAPSFGTPAANSWTTAHGIGNLRSDSTDTALRGFLRGGAWGDTTQAGVFNLNLTNVPTLETSNVGFRMTRSS